MIHFIAWKWRSKTYRTVFEAKYVNVLQAMLRRHHKAEHRLVCITDDPKGVNCETFPLWDDHASLVNPSGIVLPSCYRRLKILAGETTQAMGIEDGEKVVSLDLDMVVTSDLVPLFQSEADFVGWKGIGTYRPCVYNGSMWMFRAGRSRWLWDEFDPVLSPQKTRAEKYFGSDQAWLSYRLNGSAPGWDIEDGVYSFARDIHRRQQQLPRNARIVFFNGKRKPWDKHTQREQPWITRHWRA